MSKRDLIEKDKTRQVMRAYQNIPPIERQHDNAGQAVVEAALLIPALLLSLLLLIQPGILLYTRMVMEGAAAEGCRILATTSELEQNTKAAEGFVKRRLASIPQQQNFHVHEPTCTWSIVLTGNETTSEVSVEISTEVKPLPLFDFGLEALGVLNGQGNYELKVSRQLTTKTEWVRENAIGSNPKRWIDRWNDS